MQDAQKIRMSSDFARKLLAMIALALGVSLVGLLFSNSALAQPYIGFSFMSLDYKEANVRDARQPAGSTTVFGTNLNPVPTNFNNFRTVDDSLEGVSFKYGYTLSNFFALEFRGGFGVSSIVLTDFREELRASVDVNDPNDPFDDVQVIESNPLDSELSMKYYYGLYAKVGVFRTWWISPYVLYGQSRGNFEVPETAVGATGGDKLVDESLGAGFNVRITDTISASLEYIDLFDKSGIDVNNTNLSIEYWW